MTATRNYVNLCVMITDFHTHYYPPELAPRALRGVDDVVEGDADGTLGGLKRAMRAAGVTRAVALPVCAKPNRESAVNGYVESTAPADIIPFFSVHPYSDGAPDLVRKYADSGLKGIKLHSNIQRFSVSDSALIPFWQAIKSRNIIAVFHCGRPGKTPTEHDVYPSDFLPLFDILSPSRTVLAHTGGYGVTDDELDVLAQTGAYTDLSLAQSQFTVGRFRAALGMLSPDRLLFGSDSPWRDIGASLNFVRSAVSDPKLLDKILCENARTLLGE